jgi:ParB family chromosome partitioning protein
METQQKVKVTEIERDPEQPRKEFDEKELLALGENMMRHGQLVPLILFLMGAIKVILDGERRWRAAQLVGMSELNAIVLPERVTAATLAVLRSSLDIHRASLNLMERSDLLAKIKSETGWSVGEIVEQLNITQPLVTKLLSCQKVIPDAQRLIRLGKLDIEKAFILSQQEPADQLKLLSDVGKLSRDQLRGRTKRNGEQSKAKRAVFMLSSGLSITVQGLDVTLEDAIEGLAEVAKELKRGLSQGLDISTAQRVMRDKAKVAV